MYLAQGHISLGMIDLYDDLSAAIVAAIVVETSYPERPISCTTMVTAVPVGATCAYPGAVEEVGLLDAIPCLHQAQEYVTIFAGGEGGQRLMFRSAMFPGKWVVVDSDQMTTQENARYVEGDFNTPHSERIQWHDIMNGVEMKYRTP